MDNEENIIDEKSGISIEEQKEILVSINKIAEKNRKTLSENSAALKLPAVKAKKSGRAFPMAVNIIAVVVLLGGVFALIYFNGLRDIQIRTGTGAMEVVAMQPRISNELDSAMQELERLTNEQDRINSLDALISGGLVSVSNFIKAGEYDRAAQSIADLRQLSNRFTFTSHAFASRKIFYNQSLDIAQALMEDAQRQSDLLSEIGLLGETVSVLQGTIDDQEGEISRLDGIISERDTAIRSQNTRIEDLGRDITARNTRIEEISRDVNRILGERERLQGTVNTISGVVQGRNISDMTIAQLNNSLEEIIAALENR